MPAVLSLTSTRQLGVRREHFLYFTLLSNGPGAMLAWVAHRFGLTPNVVTICGVILIAPAALLNSNGAVGWSFLLFHLFFVFDCADGILARATNQKSTVGAYLDDLAHEIFQPIFVVSLGWGFWRQGDAYGAGVCMMAAAMNSLLRANTELIRHQLAPAPAGGGESAGHSWLQRTRWTILSTIDYPNMLLGMTATVWHRQAFMIYLWYCSAMSVAYVVFCGARAAWSGRATHPGG